MKLYHVYFICIRRIQFKTTCKNECTVTWKNGMKLRKKWNKGKQNINGYCFGQLYESSELLFRVISKRQLRFTVSIVNGELQGKIIVTNKKGELKWRVKGDIEDVEGTVSMEYFNQLSSQKQQSMNAQQMIQQQKQTINNQPIDMLLFRELVSRDVSIVQSEIPVNEIKQYYLMQKQNISYKIENKLYEEIIREMKENIFKMNIRLSRLLIKEVHYQHNEVFWLGCLLSLRQQLIHQDTFTLNEILTIGKLLDDVDGVVSLVENSIVFIYKATRTAIVNRIIDMILEVTTSFKQNGIIDDKIVGFLKNELLKIKQEMIMTHNTTHYSMFMESLVKKLNKRIQQFDQWELIVMKYIVDSLSSWCSSNEINFSPSLSFFQS